MRKCSRCSFENYSEANYCQKCGKYIKGRRISLCHVFAGGLAKFANSGYVMAPLIGLQIDSSKKSNLKKSNIPIIPLEDGSWYCPDCGEHNKKNQFICRGCGKEYNIT